MTGKHSKKLFDLKSFNLSVFKSAFLKQSTITLPFKITIITLICSLVASTVLIGGYFWTGHIQKNILSESSQLFKSFGGCSAVQTLAKKNQDITGWLNVENTDICYAVCQSDDSSYYSNHNQFGKKSRYGALFLSGGDSFERTNNDRNIVIYGNNMKDGTMFGNLKKYRNINFYKQNPCIDIYFGDTQETYVVFAVLLTSSLQDDTGNYKPYKSQFNDKAEFNDWYDETCTRSIINTRVTASLGDDILTLITSAPDFEGARLVVMAKRTENPDSARDSASKATVNAHTKYPKIWYTSRGLDYPY